MSPVAQRRIGFGVFLAIIAVGVVLLITMDPDRGRPVAIATGSAVRIPIEVDKSYDDTLVTVPVTIRGQRFEFALDTGASTSAVNGTVLQVVDAEDLGEDALFADASGDVESSRLFSIDRWSMGEVPLQADAVVSNLARPLDVDGLLGSDQLSRFGRVTIDYDAEVLIVVPRER